MEMDESKYENIERYLDKLMDEAERSAFEASLEKDNELAEALAQQKEVNAALGDIVEADLKAELMAKGASPLADEFTMWRFGEGKFIDESVAAGVAH